MSHYEIQIQVHIRKTDRDVTQEVYQAGEGDFRTVISGVSGQSIDACEQALLRVNYPALRDALSGHLSEVSKEAAAQDRIGALKKTPVPTRSMVKSGALALRRTVE